jgi:hypothetical protein
MTLPTACTGHLLVDLPIFAGPVLVLGGWLVWTTLRARRDGEQSVLPGAEPQG